MLLVSLLLLSFFVHFLTFFFCLCIHLQVRQHKQLFLLTKWLRFLLNLENITPLKEAIFKSDIYFSSSFEDIFLITFKDIFDALRGHFKGGHLCSTVMSEQ